MFLVIGHNLSGYEQYLAKRSKGEFDLHVSVPA